MQVPVWSGAWQEVGTSSWIVACSSGSSLFKPTRLKQNCFLLKEETQGQVNYLLSLMQKGKLLGRCLLSFSLALGW